MPRVFDWGAGTGGWSCFALLLQSVAGCLGVAVVLALVVAWGGTVRERFFFFFFFLCGHKGPPSGENAVGLRFDCYFLEVWTLA